MSRLEAALRTARTQGRKILVPFFTGGYPDRETFLALLGKAQECGADAVEVGIPFSDPSADGPVIQRTSYLALEAGVTVKTLLADVAEARRRGLTVPLLFMTYYNPILAFGPEDFAREAAQAGADGALVVDLPPEESEEFAPAARAAGLDTVFLVAPTTPDSRLPTVVREARGFVYCVSVTGVTGEKQAAADSVGRLVARVRRLTDLPVLVGFGVDGPASASAISAVSDGVIVGSALLRAAEGLRGGEAAAAVGRFLSELRQALDR